MSAVVLDDSPGNGNGHPQPHAGNGRIGTVGTIEFVENPRACSAAIPFPWSSTRIPTTPAGDEDMAKKDLTPTRRQPRSRPSSGYSMLNRPAGAWVANRKDAVSNPMETLRPTAEKPRGSPLTPPWYFQNPPSVTGSPWMPTRHYRQDRFPRQHPLPWR
jgi:hypothetical protein